MNRPDDQFVDISGLPQQIEMLLGSDVPGIRLYSQYYAILTRVNPSDITGAINFALERVGQKTERRFSADSSVGQLSTLVRLILKFARDIAGLNADDFELYAAVSFLLRYIVGPLVPEAIVVITELNWAEFRLRFIKDHLQQSLNRRPREVSEATTVREAIKAVALNAEWRTHFGNDAFSFFPSSRLGRTLYRRAVAAQEVLSPGRNQISRQVLKMVMESHRQDGEILRPDDVLSQCVNRARTQRRREISANRRFNQSFRDLLCAFNLPPNCSVDFINFSPPDVTAATEVTVCAGQLGNAGFGIQVLYRRFRTDRELHEFLMTTVTALTEQLSGGKPKNGQ